MNILVCIKQVPDTIEVKTDPETHTLLRAEMPAMVNPFDKNALEAAVQLKEAHGGSVTVLTLGPEQGRDALKECLSVGADRAVLITDPSLAGSDTYATSYILSRAIQTLGNFDLILCGKQAIDGETAQTGPAIAEHLGLTQLTYAAEIEVEGSKISIHRETDEGYEVIEANLPVVCTVVKSINEPRFATIKSKMAANKARIEVLTAADLPGLAAGKIGRQGSLTRVKNLYAPPKRKAGLQIKEETGRDTALKLMDKLVEAGLI